MSEDQRLRRQAQSNAARQQFVNSIGAGSSGKAPDGQMHSDASGGGGAASDTLGGEFGDEHRSHDDELDDEPHEGSEVHEDAPPPPPLPRRETHVEDVEAELDNDEQLEDVEADGVMGVYLRAVFERVKFESSGANETLEVDTAMAISTTAMAHGLMIKTMRLNCSCNVFTML